MTIMQDIQIFAMKWHHKFEIGEEIDVAQFGLECQTLGFDRNLGYQFFESHEKLKDNIIWLVDVSDTLNKPMIVGAIIYAHWQLFVDGKTGMLDSEIRVWFLLALKRLEKLVTEVVYEQYTLSVSRDEEILKEEVAILRQELVELILERDSLIFVQCKNIEMAYMLVLGHLEYKAYELHVLILRLKRKMTLIQMKKNRQEVIDLVEIEQLLNEEFAAYQVQLEAQLNKMNEALQWQTSESLTDDEMKEMKKLYRSIVKKLHPDLHPEISEAELTLFYSAVSAYESGDLFSLRLISSTVGEVMGLSERQIDPIQRLLKDRELLQQVIQKIKDRIVEIKNEYPYIMKELVNDAEKIAEKKDELLGTIAELNEILDLYQTRIEEMLR